MTVVNEYGSKGVFMDATTSLTTTDNQVAANKMEAILNQNDVKSSIANLARVGTGAFQKIVEGIQDTSNMDNAEIRAAVVKTFEDAMNEIQEEINTLNKIPSFKMGMEVKTLEEGLTTLLKVEKEILDDKDTNIIKRMLMMFWTGVKYICGLILKSCIAAGKFVLEYGIRIIAVGLDFVFRIIQKTVKFFKTIVRIAAAVRVGIDGTETPEIIDVEASEYY